MKTILQDKSKYILKFQRGEDVIESLKDFCKKNKVKAAYFTAIGAADELTLSFYNIKTKEYEDKDLKEDFEITSVLGNVAWAGEELIIHCHGTFADKNLKIVGGHVKRMVISGTCEMVFEIMSGEIERDFDEETGLKLMS